MPPGVQSVGAKEQEEGVRAQLLMSLAMSQYQVTVSHTNVTDQGKPAFMMEDTPILEGAEIGTYLVTIRKIGNVRLNRE